MNSEDPDVFCVADDISVLCMHLHLCSTYSAQVLAELAEEKSSSHSYHPSMTFCVVPGVLSCVVFASRCEICVLLLRAYIICLFRSCVTVSNLISFFLSSWWSRCKVSITSFGTSVCLFAGFSAAAALHLNLTFSEQIKSMYWECDYCCDCIAALKAQVLLFSEGRVVG